MFRLPSQTGAKPQSGFVFGGAADSGAAAGGFAFAASTGASTSTASGFTLGSATAPTTAATAPKSFSFGTAATATQSPFSFISNVTTTATTSAAAPNISLGVPGQKPGGLFGTPSSTSVTAPTLPTTGINFGAATCISSTSGIPASATMTSTTGSGFGSTPSLITSLPQSTGSSSVLGTPTPLGGQSVKLGTTTTAPTAFGTPVSSNAFGLGTSKKTATTITAAGAGTTTTAGVLGGITSTTATTGITLGGFGSTASSSAATSAPSTAQTTLSSGGSVVSSTPQLTYKQLEEQINKWVSDLEDYERTFLDQAAQVNKWDRLLMENGEKITELNGNVENVKAEQKRLDEELDFILAQQQELEVLLKPLEEELEKRTTGPGQLQHADREREFTYGLAKDVDGQLKQMVGDLKSIIDHLNTAGLTQQENNDPIMKVAKILNAHMNSLQWIDQNAALLQRKVDEVSSLSEIRRKEQERNFRLAFD